MSVASSPQPHLIRVAIFGVKRLPAVAGADRVVERLIEHLPEDVEPTVYLLRDGSGGERCRQGVYIQALRGKHLRAFSFFLFSTLHFLVKGRSEVAHVHNSDFGMFCALLRLKRGVRIVGTFHGDPYERAKWSGPAKAFLRLSEWTFVRSCHVLVSVSPLKTVPGRTVHYIPNGVDRAPPATARSSFPYARLGLTQGDYLMFSCGRLDETKGLHHLLRAYKSVPEDHPLLVIGDFDHSRKYSDIVEREAARDPRVILVKQLLGQETLFDAIRNSRLFIFPSEIEGMSMTLLEALACRKLPICSDIPENLAVVGQSYPFLFKSGDSDSLVGAIARVLRNPPDDDLVDSTLARVMRAFQWDDIAAAYARIYQGAAA